VLKILFAIFVARFNNNNNNNNQDNVYGAVIMAKVHSVHLMNAEWRQSAADPKPSQTT